MATNRLYIGNKETGEYMLITKTDSDLMWGEIGVDYIDLINKIIRTDLAYYDKSNLVFFTELDDEIYSRFIHHGSGNLGTNMDID